MQQKDTRKSHSWLGSTVFVFTTIYLHLSLASAETLSAAIIFFMGLGLAAAVALIDLPAFYLQQKLINHYSDQSDLERHERLQQKAGAIGTFIKAVQVAIAFVACKYTFMALMV